MGLALLAPGASADTRDCAGPVGDAQPGTPQWTARDSANVFCAQVRHSDFAANPVDAGSFFDRYRDPTRNDGVRFRFTGMAVKGGGGPTLRAEVYRPCARDTCRGMPSSLRTFEPPYPVIVTIPGGASHKELHWWSSQPLAEAGYMVVTIDPTNTIPTEADARSATDWVFDPRNPLASQIDRKRVGIAGHSTGGALSSRLGQVDPRLKASVAWDRGPEMPPPKRLDKPTLFITGDWGCQVVPVCQPEPRTGPPPNPDFGPWPTRGGNPDYQRVRDAGTDTMKLSLRATTHLDWTPPALAGNRYAELVTMYFTTAWFDRYLKGPTDPKLARDAFRRLIADRFDGSADVHNISQGFYDPAKAAAAGDPYAGNVPYTIRGQGVADRLSFYFRSKCFLTTPGGGRSHSEDMRKALCRAVPASCLNSRGGARGRRLGPAVLGRTRARQRRVMRGRTLRTRARMDRYCATGGGSFRIGYRRGRVVLILTSSRRFSVRGVRRGASTRVLRGARRVRVGRNTWYLRRGGAATLVYKTRARRVLDVGLADRRLTRTRAASRRFLRTWELR